MARPPRSFRGNTILISGVYTHLAVEATVRQARDYDYHVVVLKDCCAAPDPDLHAHSMERILPFLSVTLSSDEVVSRLKRATR